MINFVKMMTVIVSMFVFAGYAMAQQSPYPQQSGYQQPQQVQQQPVYQQQAYPNTGAVGVQGYQQRGYVVPRTVKSDSVSQADGIFGIVRERTVIVFRNVRSIVFILGGFALVALAVMAIFGKPNWKWFAMLAVGIFVVAIAGAIVEYLAGQETDLGNTIQTQPTQTQPVYRQPTQPVYR